MDHRASHAADVMNAASKALRAAWIVAVASGVSTPAVLGAYALSSSNAPRSGGAITGHWSAEVNRSPGSLQFAMWRSRNGFSQSSSNVALESLQGLTREDIMGDAQVQFDLVRDAGTIHCQGSFDRGEGSGKWQFEPNPDFAKGIAIASLADVTPEEQFGLAMTDVSRAFCADLKANGYDDLSYDEVMAFRVHDIDGDYIEGLARAGYRSLAADDLVAARVHGMDPEFVASLRKLGYEHVSMDDLVAMRVHGVDEDFIAEMASLGYEHVPIDDLVAMRVHGVSAGFINELGSLGYKHVSVDDLVALRVHGVTTRYIQDQQTSRGRPSIDQIISMKVHGW